MAFSGKPVIVINPGLQISLTDTTVVGGPATIITPGQSAFTASFTLFRAPVYTTSNVTALQIPFVRPDPGNFIPIVYVRNIDPANPVVITIPTIGGVGIYSTSLFPGSYFFQWIPVGQQQGQGVAGIEPTLGIGIQAVAPTVFVPVEIFYAA